MSEGPLNLSQRQMLRSLTALSGDRAKREEEIRATLDTRQRRARAEHDTNLAALTDRTSAARDAAETELREGTERITADAQSQRSRITLQLQGERGSIVERAEVDRTAAKKRLQEAVWMGDTILDGAMSKEREKFNKLDKQLTENDAALTKIDAAAAVLLSRYVLTRAGTTPAWLDGISPSETQFPSPADTIKDQTAAANVQLDRLASMPLPPMMMQPLPWVYALLAAGGVGAGVAWLRAWQVDNITIAAAVASLVVFCVFAFLALGAVRRSVIRIARPLHTSLATARAAIAHARTVATHERAEAEAKAQAKREREVTFAKEQYEETRQELAQIRERKLSDIDNRLKSKLEAIDRACADALRELQERCAAAAAAAELDLREGTAALAETLDSTLSQAQRDHDQARADLIRDWTQGLHDARAVDAQVSDTRAPFLPWSADRWAPDAPDSAPNAWTPAATSPRAIPVAHATLALASLPGGVSADAELSLSPAGAPGPDTLHPAAFLELPDHASLLLQFAGDKSGGTARTEAINVLRSTMLRLLTSFPPGKLRFTILDPVGLGQSFAGFMHLADYEDALVTDKIWTEPRHIEARLTDLTEHMENVIQKYLRNQFKSIEEYNEQAGEIAEPYRFLVIADFPANFSEVSAKRLASILASGPRCGVYTLIAMDTRQQLPAGLTAADLKRNALRFTYRKGDPAATPPTAPGLVWDDPDFGSLPVAVEQPPDDERFNALVHRVGVASKDANRVQVPFAMIAPQGEQLWTMSSASEVRVALGRAGATKLQHLSLGRGTSQHALIAGRTGSGKSTLLHAIITNLAMWYTPDEVELYLIDFKKGVEFKAYASLGLPHARVIAIESEREFGLSVLRKLDAELKRRGNLFRDQEVQDLKSFRSARADVPMPRIMLIVDEFQELFVEDDKLAQEASLLLDRLVRQGRAFGMHVILGSQTLGGAYSLARATIGQMAVRIALQCSEADAMLIMSDDNSAPRLLNRPGEAIYNDASGAIEGNSPFQVAWLPDEQREHFLSQVRSRIPTLPESTRARLVPPIVFEGNVPANIEANHPLSLALAAAAPVEHGKPTSAWLGDAIAIKDPSAGIFRRQAGANLLIVGQKDDSALAMMVASILSLAAQHAQRAGTDAASPAPRIYLLDGTPADQPGFGVLPKLAASLSDVLDIRVIALRDVPGAMNELNAELSRRTALAAESESGSAQPPSWYLFVHALQRYRALRRSENEFDFSASTGDEPDAQVAPEKAFANIMREGAAMGIHTLCWCDTVANLTRTLERNALREFDQRVLFQMSGADSSALMDTPFAGTIGNNRALLYSEEQGSVEKFRPYAMPSDAWLAATINRLTRRTPTPEPTR